MDRHYKPYCACRDKCGTPCDPFKIESGFSGSSLLNPDPFDGQVAVEFYHSYGGLTQFVIYDMI
jgi:hypothetical protein